MPRPSLEPDDPCFGFQVISRGKLQTAAKAGADVVVLDLEDGVAADRKDAARDSVAGALKDLDFNGAERFVRVAGRKTLRADLAAATGADGICLPKVEGHDDLTELRSTAVDILGRVPQVLAISAESPLGVLSSGTLARFGRECCGLDVGLGGYGCGHWLPCTAARRGVREPVEVRP